MSDDNTASEFMHAQSDIIKKVTESMPDEEILYDLAELFKICLLYTSYMRTEISLHTNIL